jgi:hypothetical protein
MSNLSANATNNQISVNDWLHRVTEEAWEIVMPDEIAERIEVVNLLEYLIHLLRRKVGEIRKFQKFIDTAEGKISVEDWFRRIKEEGTRIDPETAIYTDTYAALVDPYGVFGELPEEMHQHQYDWYQFARSPESEIWVEFEDLPEDTRNRILERIRLGELTDHFVGNDDYIPF